MASTCRSCGGSAVELLLDLGEMPLAGGFLEGPDDVAQEQIYPLSVHVCRACALVQILQPIDPAVLFNDYSFSASTIPVSYTHLDWPRTTFAVTRWSITISRRGWRVRRGRTVFGDE